MTQSVESALRGTITISDPEANFSAVGSAFVIRGKDLAKGNALPRYETVEVAWIGWTEQSAAAMVGRCLAGDTSDGRYAIVELKAVIEVVHGTEESMARFAIGLLQLYAYRPPGHGQAVWVYRLLNHQMKSGDLLVQESRGDGSIGWRRDAIRFEYAGREWLLRDELRTSEDQELRDFRKHSAPIQSGTLWTEKREDDIADEIDLLAMQVCNLLSFATERSVRWMTREEVDATGKVSRGRHPSVWCAPASDGGNGPIDTASTESLATFLTTAGRQVAAAAEWWNRTLELHLQGVLSPIIDVRLTILYVLLDRISRRVITVKEPFQIAAGLNERLDEKAWKSEFSAVLWQLTDAWTNERTEALVGVIKGWNKEPSFSKRVKQAAVALGLREPHGQLVKERNLLLHYGEVPERMPASIRHIGDFSRAVESLVTAMLLRILGHEGNAYLPDAGRHHLPLLPWPADRPVPWDPQL
jgi:hypothetical protein